MKITKKTYIIVFVGLLLLMVIFGFFIFKKNSGKVINLENGEKKIFSPEFMSNEEKKNLEIPVELKIQTVSRDEYGDVEVYKVIKDDSDIINPADIKPISPRMTEK